MASTSARLPGRGAGVGPRVCRSTSSAERWVKRAMGAGWLSRTTLSRPGGTVSSSVRPSRLTVSGRSPPAGWRRAVRSSSRVLSRVPA